MQWASCLPFSVRFAFPCRDLSFVLGLHLALPVSLNCSLDCFTYSLTERITFRFSISRMLALFRYVFVCMYVCMYVEMHAHLNSLIDMPTVSAFVFIHLKSFSSTNFGFLLHAPSPPLPALLKKPALHCASEFLVFRSMYLVTLPACLIDLPLTPPPSCHNLIVSVKPLCLPCNSTQRFFCPTAHSLTCTLIFSVPFPSLAKHNRHRPSCYRPPCHRFSHFLDLVHATISVSNLGSQPCGDQLYCVKIVVSLWKL